MFQLKFSPEPLKNSLITRLTTSTNGFRTGPQIDFQILQKKKQKNKAKTQTPGEKKVRTNLHLRRGKKRAESSFVEGQAQVNFYEFHAYQNGNYPGQAAFVPTDPGAKLMDQPWTFQLD